MKRILFSGESPTRCVHVFAHPDQSEEVASAACEAAREENIQVQVHLSPYMPNDGKPCIIDFASYYKSIFGFMVALCLLCSCVSDPPRQRWHLHEPEVKPVAPKEEKPRKMEYWT